MSCILTLSSMLLLRWQSWGPRSSLLPAGPASAKIAHLNWFVLILFLIVIAVMWSLILLVVTRKRGSFQEHAPFDAGGGQSWILIGGFAIPATILFVIFIMGLDTMSAFPLHDGHEMPPNIRVTGHQWWWEVQYLSGGVDKHFITANEIHIPVGRPMDIDLVSADMMTRSGYLPFTAKLTWYPARSIAFELKRVSLVCIAASVRNIVERNMPTWDCW